MKLVETPKSLEIYFRHITKPRATFFDLLVSTAIYELFCNKNALEVGCFTGANTLHLANIAKVKNTTVIALDNWAQACEQAGCSIDSAIELFYAHINLVGAKDHCRLIEKDFNDICSNDIDNVDYIFFDIEFASTNELSELFNKVYNKSTKFFFIIDDVRIDKNFLNYKNNINIENFIEQTSSLEIFRSINRSYIAVGYTNKEIIELQKVLSEVISFGKSYLNNMESSEKIYYQDGRRAQIAYHAYNEIKT